MRLLDKLNNQKGSTLLFVVITVAILAMLGTALLSMSLMNINMKHNDNRIKKTLYYAESGIDQVYARVGKLVEMSINEAIANTDDDIKIILNEIDAMLQDENNIPPFVGINSSITYVDEAPIIELRDLILPSGAMYMLDTEALKVLSDKIYRYHFRSAMNSNGSPSNLRAFLDSELFVYLDDNTPAENNSSININTAAITVTQFLGANSTYRVEGIESTFILGDHTKKQISTDIVVSDQVKSYPLNTIEKRILVPDNPIWQKALVAHEDISFNSSTVADIHGDVYGYGNLPTGNAIHNPKNYGGILVNGTSRVTVHGNIFSRSYVQLRDGSSTNARLTVNNGLVYANSVVLQDGASGQMNFNGNVYTSDDLELNGTGGRININGSYYGYTDGSGTGITHDLSSAIVINADMNAGSSLSIDGAFNKVPVGTTKKDIDFLESHEGILIGGTAYVDVQPTRYQTGESVSLKGNFVAYTWGFDQETIDLMKSAGDNFFNKAPYDFYAGSGTIQDAEVEGKFLKDNVSWMAIDGTTISLAKGTTTEEYELNDRKAYFVAFKHYIDGNSNTFIKTGPGIILENYIYTTGLKLVKDPTHGVNDFLDLTYHNGTNINKVGQEGYDNLRIKISEDHIYQLHMMRHRSDMGAPSIDNPDPDPLVDPTYYNVNAVDKFTKIDTMGSLNYNNAPYPTVASVLNAAQNALEITYVNDATAQTLHIYGGGSSGTNSPSIDIPSGRAQGIVVHNGDIMIHGDLAFAGPIISGGSITAIGGTQTYKNNSMVIKNYLAQKIYEDNVLYNLFNVVDRSGPGSAPVYLEEIEFVDFDDSTTLDLNNNSPYRYSDLMRFEFWKVEE
ncbi:type II secretion system protein [Petrocella sp. FN5]|uniref:type II secretion system protein n=1 Tax=Petrocella sp. FN5 TaxID=3032002 RepID=UPI0023DAE471|nr:hypothetical protein [Petrocella sp. FN5]MDF1617026.1 hypothetical protein [Petrocella sp. FN5]